MYTHHRKGSRLNLRIAVMQLGVTQAHIARELGVTPQFLCDVLSKRRRSKRVIDALFNKYGLPAEYQGYFEKAA